jgi:hypothetical protein
MFIFHQIGNAIFCKTSQCAATPAVLAIPAILRINRIEVNERKGGSTGWMRNEQRKKLVSLLPKK